MTELKSGTPLPWTLVENSWDVSTIYDQNGDTVAECPISALADEETQDEFGALMQANAAYIVHACNEYPALLALVGELVGALEPFAEQAELYDDCEQHNGPCPDSALSGEMLDITVGQFRQARATLTRAKEQQP